VSIQHGIAEGRGRHDRVEIASVTKRRWIPTFRILAMSKPQLAEADGNRTRLRALARTPVLKTGGPTRRPDASSVEDSVGVRMQVR
jgi:hypothetical protein